MTNNPNTTNLTSTNSRLQLAAIGWRREHHQPMRKERIMTSITRRNALTGASAAAGAMALGGPALASGQAAAILKGLASRWAA